MHAEMTTTTRRADALYNEAIELDMLYLQSQLPWVDASDIRAAFRPFRAERLQHAIEEAVQESWEPRTSLPSSVMDRFGSGPEVLEMYTQAQVRAHEVQLALMHSTQANRTAAHDQQLRLIIDSFGSQTPTVTTVAHQAVSNPIQTFDQVFIQQLGATDPLVASITQDLIAIFRDMEGEDSNTNDG